MKKPWDEVPDAVFTDGGGVGSGVVKALVACACIEGDQCFRLIPRPAAPLADDDDWLCHACKQHQGVPAYHGPGSSHGYR